MIRLKNARARLLEVLEKREGVKLSFLKTVESFHNCPPNIRGSENMSSLARQPQHFSGI